MKKPHQLVNRAEHNSFIQNAFTIQGSVTPIVMGRVVFIVIYAAIISFIHHYHSNIFLPVGPFEYAGLILGLILVFRLNSGYDRWWEARKIWGSIVNQSRNLAMIVLEYAPANEKLWRIKMAHYTAALPYLIKNYLRGDPSINEVEHLLDEDTKALLVKAQHKPNMLTSLIAKELNSFHKSSKLDSFSFLQAEEKRGLLVDSYGASERILKTPIPYAMAIKCRRFIFLFLLALPFALVEISITISPIICGLVAYALFSLDQIGFELQNPFIETRLSHLPLTEICQGIETNIQELIAL